MSELEAWKQTERAMASQDLTLHNLGDDIWEVADQMLSAIAELKAALEGRDRILLEAYHEAGGFDSPKGFENWLADLRARAEEGGGA